MDTPTFSEDDHRVLGMLLHGPSTSRRIGSNRDQMNRLYRAGLAEEVGREPSGGNVGAPLKVWQITVVGTLAYVVRWLRGEEAETVRIAAVSEDVPPEDAFADRIEQWI